MKSDVLHACGLDEAWHQAEAVLPAGSCDLAVYHYDDGPPINDDGPYGWYAPHQAPAKYAAKTIIYPTAEEVYGYGLSPESALRDLIARLVEREKVPA